MELAMINIIEILLHERSIFLVHFTTLYELMLPFKNNNSFFLVFVIAGLKLMFRTI